MVRRDFVVQILGMAASLGLVELFGFSESKSSAHHVCSIEIEFAPNHSLSSFLTNRNKWMRIDDYERIIKDFEQRGLLIKKDRSFLASSVRIDYFFENIQNHDAFVSMIDAFNAVSDSELMKIGYKFNRKYYRVSRQVA